MLADAGLLLRDLSILVPLATAPAAKSWCTGGQINDFLVKISSGAAKPIAQGTSYKGTLSPEDYTILKNHF